MTTASTTALIGLFALQGVGASFGLADAEAQVVPEPEYPTYTVSMTGYNAVPGQTDSTPDRTSIGAYTNPQTIAARSSDLADELPYGTVIEVLPNPNSTDPNCGLNVVQKSMGLRVIADAMHPRKRKQIDILFDTEVKVRAAGRQVNRAVALGVCKDVTIRVVGSIDTKKMPKNQQELRLAVGVLEKADEQKLAIKKD